MSSVCVITRAVLKEHTEPVLTSFYLEKDKLTEIHPHLEGRSLLGNIYVGKVKHVVKNIDAAFVEIAGGQTCYLPFKEAQAPVLTNRRWDGRLLAGDEILVQVMRDALKTKEPALTAKISLEGRLAAVVLDGGHGVRYSKQLPKEAADHFREVLQSVTVPDGMTLVVRTAAGDAADTALLHEANALLEKAQKLLSVGRSRTVFSMISEERPGWLIELLSHKQLPDKIVTDETLAGGFVRQQCIRHREKSARRCSGFRGAVRQKNSGAAGRHEMPGNFVLQGQPTEFVCTLRACREAGRSACEARLAKIRRISGHRTNRSAYGDRCQYRKI